MEQGIVLTDDEISTYLAAALDQVACKDTLRAALVSRVESLIDRGISTQILRHNLECMRNDPYQINDDVIVEVMEQWTKPDR